MEPSYKKRIEIFGKAGKKSFSIINQNLIGFKVGFLIFLIISFFILNEIHFSKGIKNFFYSISAPVQKLLWEKGSDISNFLGQFSNLSRLSKENEKLKFENKELLAKLIEFESLKKENEFLRKALGLDLEKDFKLQICDVIGKEIAEDFLIINKGSKDGVSFGEVAITNERVLVGKIVQVYEDISKVQLITSKNSSFDVEILDKEIYGLGQGSGNRSLMLKLVPAEKEINVGDSVITSALGGNFPKDLLVGRIQEVRKTDVISFQEADIKPGFNLNELKQIFVITGFIDND